MTVYSLAAPFTAATIRLASLSVRAPSRVRRLFANTLRRVSRRLGRKRAGLESPAGWTDKLPVLLLTPRELVGQVPHGKSSAVERISPCSDTADEVGTRPVATGLGTHSLRGFGPPVLVLLLVVVCALGRWEYAPRV